MMSYVSGQNRSKLTNLDEAIGVMNCSESRVEMLYLPVWLRLNHLTFDSDKWQSSFSKYYPRQSLPRMN